MLLYSAEVWAVVLGKTLAFVLDEVSGTLVVLFLRLVVRDCTLEWSLELYFRLLTQERMDSYLPQISRGW